MGSEKENTQKPEKERKTPDIRSIEEQAFDIMKATEMPDTKDIGISEEMQKRVDDADTSELDNIEQELGIHAPEIMDELEQKVTESSEIMEEPTDIKQEAEEIPEQGAYFEPDVEKQPQEEKVDGKFEIYISDDKMTVSIDLSPSRGIGVPLSFERVKAKLFSMKVVHGVNYELLERLVENAERTKQEKSGVVIAQGTPAEVGKDGSIEFIFSENEDILQLEEDEGRVN